MTRAGSAALALLATLLFRVPAWSSVIEYLYVEPNVGGSTGGHVALRFDDTVYDFQNRDLGTLRLARHAYEHFRYVYSVLENRTIHAARLRTAPDTYDALLDRFNERYFVQERHFAILDSLRNDCALLRTMLEGRETGGGDLGAALRGAGFFYGKDLAPPSSSAPALVALRERVRDTHGAGFLHDRIQALRTAMKNLEISAADAAPAVSKDEYPRAPYGFSERYVDLGLNFLALDVLLHARPLLPETRMAPQDPALTLTAAERQRLQAFSDSLATRLVALVDSHRPDWGFPLLIGMARLQALDESLASGRLVVLDAFSPSASTIAPALGGDRRAFIDELHDEARREWGATRTRVFAADTIDERDFNSLEDAANRFLEIRRGIAENRPIRVHADALIPARGAPGLELPLPELGDGKLRRARTLARDVQRAYVDRLRAAYGYNLIRHNCVSAIFDTIDSVFDRHESIERLGGHVDPGHGLNFVPSASFRAVTDAYDIAAVGAVLSYRKTRLEDMYATENPLKVYVRESNTVTSTIYRKGESDSLFLFFTDDVVPPRPLYGALNVVAGIGETVLGALRFPFDRGRTLWSGAKGIVFSVPELAFVNLRKGTLAYARSDGARTRMRVYQVGAPPRSAADAHAAGVRLANRTGTPLRID
jgi:hypothetical protein